MRQRGESGIYAIVNTANGKRYVGQAASISDRWQTHRSHLSCRRHANRHLQSAWDKHGADAFRFEVLERVPAERDTLARREQAWIEALAPEYNIAPVAGSSLGLKHPPRSAEFRQRMSELKRGFMHSPETIERLRAMAAAQNYKPSAAHIERLRAINTGKVKTPESIEKQRQKMVGRKQSPEVVARRNAANTGRKRTPEQRARIAAGKRAAIERRGIT